MSSWRGLNGRLTAAALQVAAQASHERMGFVWGALTNVVTTSLAFAVAPHAQLAHLMIIHLLGAVLISTRYGMVVSTVTTLTGSLAFDYFCIPPIFAFALPEPHSVLTFAGMIAVALTVCWLNQGVRLQRAAARASEARTQELCELSLDLSSVSNDVELKARAERHLAALFGPQVCLVMGGEPVTEAALMQPIEHDGRVLGQICLRESGRPLPQGSEQRLLLVACAGRIADALEHLALGDAARKAQVDAEMEHNRNALLSAVSHDMKTPLAAILTAGTSLLRSTERERGSAPELLETIVQESERLNGMITNLLSATRLESGKAVLNKQPEALDDLIVGVLSRFSGRLEHRQLQVDVPDDLPLVEVDAALVDQLLVNLLENALRYTPSGSPIDVRVWGSADTLVVDVCDRGPGVAEADRDRVFEKFFRGQAAKRNDGGTGLGLTICRAIARAHGGSVTLHGRRGGGSIVRTALPLLKLHRPVRREAEERLEA